jgi:hypothetical protein
VLNQREDSTDTHLVGGRVLHCFFEPDNYDDKQLYPYLVKLLVIILKKLLIIFLNTYLTVGNDSLTFGRLLTRYTHTATYSKSLSKLKTDQQRLDKILTDETKSILNSLKRV